MNRRRWVAAAMLLACAAAGVPAGGKADSSPATGGALDLLTASWLGGPGADELVGVAILPDGRFVLAGNGAGIKSRGAEPQPLGTAAAARERATEEPRPGKKKKPAPRGLPPGASGFLAWMNADGTRAEALAHFPAGVAASKLKLDATGKVWILGDSPGELTLAGATGTGTFVARLDGRKAAHAVFHAGAIDFDLDGEDVVVLSKAKLTRYGPDGKAKWARTWKAYGDNRPAAVAVSPQAGVAAVVGYGMTHTGKEPYKDPYAHAFGRDGEQLWSLWNPGPGREKGTKFGGNGLMADTAGHFAAAMPGGKFLLILMADGGNSVCTRDPADPDRKLDAGVFKGVFQASAGHGFRGASNTSVVFRVDAKTGRLEKGTWMTAWISPARANSLFMRSAAADDRGNVYVAGASAYGCPAKDPWFAPREGGYKGGGFLAVFDRDFKMRQCGYFAGTDLRAVSARGGRVAVAGSAGQYENEKEKLGVRLLEPMQGAYGGGKRDGYFALFRGGR